MKKKSDRKMAATFAIVFVAMGQAMHWGHPAGHSVLYYAVRAVLEGGLIAAVTIWIAFQIFKDVEKRQ